MRPCSMPSPRRCSKRRPSTVPRSRRSSTASRPRREAEMGFSIRVHRYDTVSVTVSGLSPGEAVLLREACSSPRVPPGPGFGFPGPGGLFITGTPEQIRQSCAFLRSDDRLPAHLPAQIESRLDNYLRSHYPLALRGQVLDLGSRTHIMGVLNITSDSFSDCGQFSGHDAAVDHARAMAAQG